MIFNYKSQDTLSHLSLHDCVIHHVEWMDTSLVFHMDWVDVLKTHPLNTTGKAKIAINAVLIFEGARVITSFYYDLTKAKEEGKKINKKVYRLPDDAEMVNTNIIDRCEDVEIYQDEESIEEGERMWTCSCQDDSEYKITFSTMYVCFNDLIKDSWFEK